MRRPCPGLGILAFLFSIPVVAFLIIRNIYLAFSKDKRYWVTVAFHILIIAIFLILVSSRII
jgi:hypothetical protein